jgi:hypothetical protein
MAIELVATGADASQKYSLSQSAGKEDATT